MSPEDETVKQTTLIFIPGHLFQHRPTKTLCCQRNPNEMHRLKCLSFSVSLLDHIHLVHSAYCPLAGVSASKDLVVIRAVSDAEVLCSVCSHSTWKGHVSNSILSHLPTQYPTHRLDTRNTSREGPESILLFSHQVFPCSSDAAVHCGMRGCRGGNAQGLELCHGGSLTANLSIASHKRKVKKNEQKMSFSWPQCGWRSRYVTQRKVRRLEKWWVHYIMLVMANQYNVK